MNKKKYKKHLQNKWIHFKMNLFAKIMSMCLMKLDGVKSWIKLIKNLIKFHSSKVYPKKMKIYKMNLKNNQLN